MPRFKMVDGVSIQLTSAEETARDNEEAAWAAGAFDRAIATLRQDRSRLFADTDFYALSDVTLSADMTTYRQDLRDLPSGLTTEDQFNAVTWPTKPAA